MVWVHLIVPGALLVIVATLIYQWSKKKYDYFRVRNVPYRVPKFPFGNVNEFCASESSLAKWTKDFYFEYRNQHPFAGLFIGFEPVIVVNDLNLAKSILVSNFSSFTEHGMYMNERDDPLSAVLFTLGGERWRNMRTKLAPTFSNFNTRNMFNTVYQIGDQMLDFLQVTSVDTETPFNAKNLAMRFICDSIGSCGFGLDCGALVQSDPHLLVVADNVFPRFRLRKFFLTGMYVNFSRFLRLRALPKYITDYFRTMINETVQYREENNVIRNDFMNLLIQIKNKGVLMEDESGEILQKINYDELQAQAFMIFFAGFHTSRVTLSFALFELAINWAVQEKLRDEIQNKLAEVGQLTYDSLNDMPYLEQVVNETLRKYPPQPSLSRVANADFRIPGTSYVIKKGDHLHIPVIGIHYDPEIYPDPDRFDPNRMTQEKIKARHLCSFMPFGMGPRICIGQRFGLLQVKLGIVMILTKYRLTINSKTKQPLNFLPNRIDLDVHDGIWINARPL